MNSRLKKTTATAMLAAMTCVATMIIKVPTLGTNGYVNIGDALVLISAWIMGNPYGALAAGIGSALADILSGYASYAPATAIIKYAMAFFCAMISTSMIRNNSKRFVANIIGSVVAEIIMIAGYFAYESTVLGYGLAASASIVSNAVQGSVCIVLGNALIQVLLRIPVIAALRDPS